MPFITKQGQGFRNEPHEAKGWKRVLCFDGSTFAVWYAQHVDRTNDHVVVQGPERAARLSPSDAYQLATALMNAAEALEDGGTDSADTTPPFPLLLSEGACRHGGFDENCATCAFFRGGTPGAAR